MNFALLSLWKRPARLFEQRAANDVKARSSTALPLATKSFREMVRQAVTLAGETPALERDLLFTEAGQPEPAGWPEIRKLHNLPSFSVEIQRESIENSICVVSTYPAV